MALDTRVKRLETALQGQQQEAIVVCFTDEEHPPPPVEEIEKARQKAIEEDRQVIFVGELERWSR